MMVIASAATAVDVSCTTALVSRTAAVVSRKAVGVSCTTAVVSRTAAVSRKAAVISHTHTAAVVSRKTAMVNLTASVTRASRTEEAVKAVSVFLAPISSMIMLQLLFLIFFPGNRVVNCIAQILF
jgi:hypothetical protein